MNIIKFAAVLGPGVVSAWGLPGLLAQDYRKGDEMKIMVSKIESTNTNLPYNYYDVGF